MTKRNVLTTNAFIFYPFSILSPITIKVKIFMQQLWKEKIKWDEILPENLIKMRSDFEKHLNVLKQISVPNYINDYNADFLGIIDFQMLLRRRLEAPFI